MTTLSYESTLIELFKDVPKWAVDIKEEKEVIEMTDKELAEMEKAEPLQKTPHSYTAEGECWSCEFQSYEAAELHLTSLHIPRSKWQFLYLESELTKAFERGYDTGFLVGAEKGRTLPIPEGWKLVPIESTKEMSDAFWSAYIPENKTAGAQASSFEDWWDFIHMYKAMLAAAPEYKP